MAISLQRHALSLRILSLIVAAIVLSDCTGQAPSRDAGGPEASPGTAPVVAERNGATQADIERPAHGRFFQGGRDAGAPRPPTPPDPRIVDCARATEKAPLVACLERLKSPQPTTTDAGVRLLADGRPPIVNPSWSIPNWWINPSTGNDDNSCTDSSHPCQRFAEIAARWGTTAPTITTAVVLNVSASQASTTDRVVLTPIINEGGSIFLAGVPTTLATGTLSAVVARSTSAADGRLTVTLGAAASGHLGNGTMLVNSTRSNSIAMVHAVISGTTVALTQPLAAQPAAPTRPTTFPAENNAWANGDTWVLQQLPTVYVSALQPVVPADDASGDITFAFLQHIFLHDPQPTIGLSTAFFGQSVDVTESWIEPYSIWSDAASNIGGINSANTRWTGGGEFDVFQGLGGSFDSGSIISRGLIDADAIVSAHLLVRGGGESVLGAVCFSAADLDITGHVSFSQSFTYSPHFYGTYEIDLSNSSAGNKGTPGAMMAFDATVGAPSLFLGVPTWVVDNNSFANTYDYGTDLAPLRTHRLISASNIAASVASGGFGNYVIGYAGSIIAPTNSPAGPTPTPFVLPQGSGGTGLDAGCLSGQFIGGNPLACSTPSGTGATCPINLATCVTGVLPTGNGGTNASSLPSNNLLVGGSAVTGLAPGTAGNVATSNGSQWTSAPNAAAACPINLASCVSGTLGEGNGGSGANLSGCGAGSVLFQNAGQFGCILPLPAAQGGTGQTGLPLFEVNGGTAANLSACSAGSVFIQGASQFQCTTALSPFTGGTGLTSPGANGNALLSNGTIWTSSPLPTPLPNVTWARSGSVLVGATSTDILLTTGTVTIPAGGSNLLVTADFYPNNPDVANDDISLCLSISSSSCVALVSALYSVPPSAGLATGKGFFHLEVLQTGLSAGSVSRSAFANSNTQAFHVVGQVKLEPTN